MGIHHSGLGSSFLDIASITISILVCSILHDLVGDLSVNLDAFVAIRVHHQHTTFTGRQCPIMVETEVWMNKKTAISHFIVLIATLVALDVENTIFWTR